MAGHVTPWWLAYTFDNRFRKLVHPPEEILGPYLREGMRVLDAGCGMGIFSIAMARLVGERGRVIAVDLQPQVLAVLRSRAEKAGVAGRIVTRACDLRELELDEKLDFVLAFYVMHEVGQVEPFFRRAASCLNPGGRLLLVEPLVHVSFSHFNRIVTAATACGFEVIGRPQVRFSRARLFQAARPELG